MLIEDIINEQLIQEITRPNDREKAADYLKQRGTFNSVQDFLLMY
jgi:hypothetical protein